MTCKTLVDGVSSQSALDNDRALHFGDGLFETIAIINGVPCLWERHFFRLKKGCDALAIDCPDEKILFSELKQLCQDTERAVIKIIVTAGELSAGYRRSDKQSSRRIIKLRPWPSASHYNGGELISLGLSDVVLSPQKLLAGIKHLNRLEQVIARQTMPDKYFEAVMLNQSGEVIEGIMSNILIKHNHEYLTPEIVDCGVAGVVREEMLSLANQQAVVVNVTKISVQQLKEAEELYVMNSLLGVRAVDNFLEVDFTNSLVPTWLSSVNDACFNMGQG